MHAHARYGSGNEVLDELAPEVLQLLTDGPMAFDDVLDVVCGLAEVASEWLTPYLQDPQHRRSSFDWDLGRLASILGWAGIVERAGASSEPKRYGGTRLVGGTLSLTPAGRWWPTER